MKKFFTLLFIIFICILTMECTEEETETVFKESFLEEKQDIQKTIYLDVYNLNLSTKNYESIRNLDIIGLYFEIPRIYEKVFNNNYFLFQENNIDKNMTILEQKYLSVLNKNHIINNKTVYLKGIKIKTLVVYMSDEQLSNFIKNNPKTNYSYQLPEIYN